MDTTPRALPQRATVEQLSVFAPLGALSAERLRELAEVALVESTARGRDPLSGRKLDGLSVFLLRGEILLMYAGGGTLVVVGGTGDGRFPLNRRGAPIARARAISDLDLLTLDDEVLDILVTFDQVAAGDAAAGSVMGRAVRSDARLGRGVFSLSNLRHGVFARLPAARIEELLARFERVAAHRGDVVIREGEEGDYYYVIESGRCHVERMVGGVKVALAELKSGDAFGEEALASEAKRNATVSMASDGQLLRLGKRDFNELLGEPLLQRVGYEEGLERVQRGATWLDVRYPSEYRYDKLPGAINVPLNEVRNSFAVLEPGREYIVYCQSGRRSSAAAFLFAQRGFKVCLLAGGLWAAGRGR
ncbi:MAG: cyclic nucleotide-binding domain-containing protein [Betaproteobacteria bacterium]|nr:cyclic nucleotide-binding domain-containing protein [Betaproteobacteria bacterium]